MLRCFVWTSILLFVLLFLKCYQMQKFLYDICVEMICLLELQLGCMCADKFFITWNVIFLMLFIAHMWMRIQCFILLSSLTWNSVEDILQVLIVFAVESLELDFALLFTERHILLRVLPVLVVLATSSEKDSESLYKRVKINRLINIFKVLLFVNDLNVNICDKVTRNRYLFLYVWQNQSRSLH